MSSPLPVTVHVVDDDPQARAAASYLLTSLGYLTQVYASGEEFLATARAGRGCLLLDLCMPTLSGLDLMTQLAERGIALPVVALTEKGALRSALCAMKLGAADSIEKPWNKGELVAAVERALERDARERGREDNQTAARAMLKRLSPRERQILQGLVAGLSNKEIARRLRLSPRTVEMHRANMMTDLGLESLADALRLAIAADLTALPDEGDCIVANGRPAGLAVPLDAGLDGSGEPEEAPIGATPLYAELVEATTDCAFLLDREWRFAYVNANAEAAIGRGCDLLGRNIWEAFPLAVGTRAWEELRRAAADGGSGRFECFNADLERWYDVSVRPVMVGIQVFFRDITAERTARAALQMSEETLRLALEAAGDGAWDWDVASGDIAMSPRFLARLGYASGSIPGRFSAFRQLVHAEDWPEVMRRLNRHLEARDEAFRHEYRVRRSDGSWCWIYDRGRVVARDPISGAALRMVGTAIDVSDRKAAEQLAREALERIALAQKSAGAGIWDLDLDSRTVFLCPRSLAMHGFPSDGPHHIPEAAWEAKVHPEDLSRIQAAMTEAVRTGDAFRVQYRSRGRNGRCRWIIALGKLTADLAAPARFVGLNIESTETVEAALELDKVRDELLQLSRFGDSHAMAYQLAHDLDEPLAAVTAFAADLRAALGRGDVAGRAEALAAVDGAERRARDAAEIVRRLCDKMDSRGSVERRERSRRVRAGAGRPDPLAG